AQIDPGLAQELTELLRQVVSSGTGVNAQVPGLEVCGKTGTAEGFNENGELTISSLFTGFSSNSDYPFAVAVVLDDSSAGSSAIAGQLLAAAASN
ncbi:MAG: penicillin-binding protein 2, partial [Fastidiosipila sp.]|nr:penicillin-binding protein 2 [Fastidiosipila sp.]